MARLPCPAFALLICLCGCIPSGIQPPQAAPHVDQIAPTTAPFDALRQAIEDLRKQSGKLQQSIHTRQRAVDELEEQQRSLIAAVTEQLQHQRMISAEVAMLDSRKQQINGEIHASQQQVERAYELQRALIAEVSETRRELSRMQEQVVELSRQRAEVTTSMAGSSRHGDPFDAGNLEKPRSRGDVQRTFAFRPANSSTQPAPVRGPSTDQLIREYVESLVTSSGYSVRKFIDNSMADAHRIRRACASGRYEEIDWSHPDTGRKHRLRVWQDDYSRIVLFKYR